MAKKLLMKVRVDHINDETDRVRSIILKHATRTTLQPFDAGAYVTALLQDGTRRQYSISNCPSNISSYRLGVLLSPDSRGGSKAMHALQTGDNIFISYPANTFGLCESAQKHILIAGGIGVTPILSMAHALARENKPFEFHYCGRTSADLAFLDEIKSLCPEGDLHLYLGQAEINPRRLNLQDLLRDLPGGAHVYCCGPNRMIEGLEKARINAHISEDRVHSEKFPALDSSTERFGEPFEIEIEGESDVVCVTENQSALQALREHGHIVSSSCEGGICGECKINLISGEAVHRDAALKSDEQASCFITCVSRGKGRIVVTL